MTYSGEVKEELSQLVDTDRRPVLAELSAVLYTAAAWDTRVPELSLRTENAFLYKKFFTLLRAAFNMEQTSWECSEGENGYNARITRPAMIYTILQAAGLITWTDHTWKDLEAPDGRIVSHNDARRAFIRGTFLACGSVNDPHKTYHMEFCFSRQAQADYLRNLLLTFDVGAGQLQRKRGLRTMWVVYLKDGEQIADVLNITGAHQALFKLEDIRVVKNVREQVNRQVNCEAANLDKTVSAAVRQMEDIQLIDEKIGLENLDPVLRETACARLEHEDMSLRELSILLGVGKSGVNHRFRKLSQIADRLRADQEME